MNMYNMTYSSEMVHVEAKRPMKLCVIIKYINIFFDMNIYLYIRTWIYINKLYIYIYIYICIYLYMYTYIYVYIYMYIGEMEPVEAKRLMKMCVDSGLWVAKDNSIYEEDDDVVQNEEIDD
jgi:hypothetical protein